MDIINEYNTKDNIQIKRIKKVLDIKNKIINNDKINDDELIELQNNIINLTCDLKLLHRISYVVGKNNNE